jgi:hypothetical protein
LLSPAPAIPTPTRRYRLTALSGAQVRRLLCVPGNETRAMQLFERMDTDRNGQIEWAEFKKYVDEHPELLQAFAQRMLFRQPADTGAFDVGAPADAA